MLERREAELREAMKLRHSLTTLLHALRVDMENVSEAQLWMKTIPPHDLIFGYFEAFWSNDFALDVPELLEKKKPLLVSISQVLLLS